MIFHRVANFSFRSYLSRLVTLVLFTTLTVGVSSCASAPKPSDSGSASSSNQKFKTITLTNCGYKLTLKKPATRVVTLNQGATEEALALGLEHQLVGTAHYDNSMPKKWKAAYDSVKVLSKTGYPDRETLLAAKPDLAVASYYTAFYDKALGERKELAEQGIETYLSPFSCPKGMPRLEATFDNVWAELTEVATLFGKPEAAKPIIAAQRKQLAKIKQIQSGKGKKIFWYDSGIKVPYAGAGNGGPQLVINSVGGTNIFSDLKGIWANASWEKVVAAKPDVIVLSDATWSTAQQKINYMKADPVLKTMPAVAKNQFVILPFDTTTPGVRLIEGTQIVSDGLVKLAAK